jgi:hypothetical protein
MNPIACSFQVSGLQLVDRNLAIRNWKLDLGGYIVSLHWLSIFKWWLFPQFDSHSTILDFGLANSSVANNLLSGSLPRDIFTLRPRIGSSFNFGNNNWTGTLPSEIGNWNSLDTLVINYAPQLSGTLPTEIANLKLASNVWVHNTAVYGTLPSEINSMLLLSLRVNDNLLSGTLPPLQTVFGSARSNAQELWVQGNYFTGTFPSYFGDEVVVNCTQTYMTPSYSCPSARHCSNTASERPTSVNSTGLCHEPLIFTGSISFSPAVDQSCFSGMCAVQSQFLVLCFAN